MYLLFQDCCHPWAMSMFIWAVQPASSPSAWKLHGPLLLLPSSRRQVLVLASFSALDTSSNSDPALCGHSLLCYYTPLTQSLFHLWVFSMSRFPAASFSAPSPLLFMTVVMAWNAVSLIFLTFRSSAYHQHTSSAFLFLHLGSWVLRENNLLSGENPPVLQVKPLGI